MMRFDLLRSDPSCPNDAAPCPVCGCADVELDEVRDGARRLELGACPRCDHRFTRCIEAPVLANSPAHSPAHSHSPAHAHASSIQPEALLPNAA